MSGGFIERRDLDERLVDMQYGGRRWPKGSAQ
jgi:hypothetical protein